MAELAAALFDELRHAIYGEEPPDFSQQPGEIEGYVAAVFNHLEQYNSFYQRVLGKQGDPFFKDLFQTMLSELLFEPIAGYLRLNREAPSEMIVRFYCSGFTGVANWWLEKGMPIPAGEAARQITRDILPGYLRLMGFEV
jgi:hypothetical protein